MASRLYQCILVWICTIIALYAKWRKLGDAKCKARFYSCFFCEFFPMLRSAVQKLVWKMHGMYVTVTVWKVVNTQGSSHSAWHAWRPGNVPGSNPVHTVDVGVDCPTELRRAEDGSFGVWVKQSSTGDESFCQVNMLQWSSMFSRLYKLYSSHNSANQPCHANWRSSRECHMNWIQRGLEKHIEISTLASRWTNCCPAHVPLTETCLPVLQKHWFLVAPFNLRCCFRKELKEKLDMFEEPQVLRILRRHLRSFISVEALEKACSEAEFFLARCFG